MSSERNGDRPTEQPAAVRRAEQSVDVARLLTIDVGAELSRVPGSGLAGTWQIVTELVRAALRLRATAVEVALDARRIEIRGQGARVPGAQLGALLALLASETPDGERHRALLELERQHATDLAALLALRPSDLVVESPDGWRLHRRGRGTPRMVRVSGRPPSGLRIALGGLGLDLPRARRWLQHACRFTHRPVLVNGHALSKGFGEESLDAVPLAPPLRGWLALPRQGETAIAWLLVHGVQAAQVTLPGLPCFEVAVEMAGRADALGAAALREAFGDLEGPAAEQALQRVLVLGQRVAQLGAEEASRARLLLIQWATHYRAVPGVLDTPAFEAFGGEPPHAQRWLSLAELEKLASRPEIQRDGLPALYPGRAPGDHAPCSGPVLRLDARERAALSRLLDVAFRPPAGRSGSASWRERAASMLKDAGASLARLVRLAWPGALDPIPDGDLGPGERALVAALASCHAGDLAFCPGVGPAVRGSGGRLLLPRRSRLVRAAVRAATSDPAWAYPAALALLHRRGLPSPDLRQSWLRRPRGSRQRP